MIWFLGALLGVAAIFLTGYVTDRLARKHHPPPAGGADQDWFFDQFTN